MTPSSSSSAPGTTADGRVLPREGAGCKPLVLERRPIVGGAAVTEEIAPGFRVPDARARDRAAARRRSSATCSSPGGSSSCDPIRGWSRCRRTGAPWCSRPTSRARPKRFARILGRDAERYPDFCADARAARRVPAAPARQRRRRSIAPGGRNMWELLKTGRALPRARAGRTATGCCGGGRWRPPISSANGSRPTCCRRRSPRAASSAPRGPVVGGTGAVLLLNAATDPAPGGSSDHGEGRPGRADRAPWPTRRARPAPRFALDAAVARIAVRERPRDRACSRGRHGDSRDGGDFERRSAAHVADARRSGRSRSGFLQRIRNYRMPRHASPKSTSRSAGCRRSPASPIPRTCADAFTSARASTTSSARSTRRSTARSPRSRTSTSRFRRCSIPSLAPAGPACDVRLRAVRALQARRRDATGRACATAWPIDVIADAGALRARVLESLVEHRQVLTPLDLEETLRPDRRPHLSRRTVARPALHDAAGARLGAVSDADDGLFLCGAGTHPGGGVSGLSGRNAAREILRSLKR